MVENRVSTNAGCGLVRSHWLISVPPPADIGKPGKPDLASLFLGLYGPQWRQRVPLVLGVSSRTLRYWLSGQREIPLARLADLLRFAADPRRVAEFERNARVRLADEVAYRKAADQWAKRWLRDMLETA